MTTILITGSNGLIAQTIIQKLQSNLIDINIIATSKSNAIFPITGSIKFELLDITNHAELSYIIDLYNPNIIINTAAISSPDYCENHKDECWQTNVIAVENISKICKEKNIYLQHFSTDFIFNGTEYSYPENSHPTPCSLYGQSKSESEKIVINSGCKYSIIRTSLVYGILKHQRKPNFLNWVINSLNENKHINVVSDQYRTPTLVDDIAFGSIELALKQSEGIFNLAGSELISVYDFAINIAEVFDLSYKYISGCSTACLNEAARRPIRTYLPYIKANKEIGYNPVNIIDGLNFIKKKLSELENH